MNYITSTERASSERATQQHRQQSCKQQRKEERRRRGPSFKHIKSTHTHTHDLWPGRGSRVSLYEATKNNEYSTTFSFPSTYNCAHNHPQGSTGGGAHTGSGSSRRRNVILQWRGQRWKSERSPKAGVYSSNVRKLFCMSSNSWAYSALIFTSPSFTGSCTDVRNTFLEREKKTRRLSRMRCFNNDLRYHRVLTNIRSLHGKWVKQKKYTFPSFWDDAQKDLTLSELSTLVFLKLLCLETHTRYVSFL